MEIFALGNDHQIYINAQVQAGGAWGDWNPIGAGPGVPLREISVNQNADGRLEVFALALNNQVYINAQVQAGGAWGDWNSIGGPGSTALQISPEFHHANDGELLPPIVAGPRSSGLTLKELQPIMQAAIGRWTTAIGDAQLQNILSRITLEVTDLAPPLLALTTPEAIWVDRDAAGYGWFIDATPHDDVEFTLGSGDELWAIQGGPAHGRLDLLTAMLHELGHLIGQRTLTRIP